MITTLGDMIQQARLLLDDVQVAGVEDTDLLWSNLELTQYANEAVNEVALRTGGLRDSSLTDGLTAFTIGPDDDPWQSVDARILRIVRVAWNGRRLLPVEDCPEDEAGEPSGFVFDQGARRLRPVPAPATQGVLSFTCVRLPTTTMSVLTDTPEIPVHQRANAVYWMLHRAYLKNDADTKDDGLAAKYLGLFEGVFGARPTEREMAFSARALGVTRRPILHWY